MKKLTSLAITFVFMACCSALSQASTVQVGNCLVNVVNFPSIQAAINAVPAGSTIKICSGDYYEQLTINKRLTLTGVAVGSASTPPQQDAVVIHPPAGGVIQNTTDDRGAVAAQILVKGLTGTLCTGTLGGVSINNLTVDGKGNNYNNDDLRGILYQDACGSVNHVAVRNEIPGDIPTGIQSGQGIMVETTNTTGPVQLTVQNSSVHNYNKNGILARYGGATLNATGNYVQGYGPTGVIAQNGIELAFEGAAGSIKNNTVIDNYYTGNDASASDILLYDSSETTTVSVSGNTVGNSNIGISLNNIAGSFGDNVSVTGNKVFGSSLFDGIDACSNGNTITGNSIFNSTQSGIHLDVSCIGTGTNNTVTGNTIEESECAGVLNEGSSNTTSPNTFYTVPFTVTNTTTACTPPAALVSRARTQNKVSP